MTICLVAFGANSSVNRGRNARLVAKAVRRMPGRVLRCSRFYRTPAWPPGAGPDFVNAVLCLETGWPPRAVLDRLHQTEAAEGRVRTGRWGVRTLDIDLLAWGGRISPDPMTLRHWMNLPHRSQMRETPSEMILPHPRLSDRPFVLIPLMDVAPDWRHPLTGRSVRAMVAALSAKKRREIRPLGALDGVVNRKRGA